MQDGSLIGNDFLDAQTSCLLYAKTYAMLHRYEPHQIVVLVHLLHAGESLLDEVDLTVFFKQQTINEK